MHRNQSQIAQFSDPKHRSRANAPWNRSMYIFQCFDPLKIYESLGFYTIFLVDSQWETGTRDGKQKGVSIQKPWPSPGPQFKSFSESADILQDISCDRVGWGYNSEFLDLVLTIFSKQHGHAGKRKIHVLNSPFSEALTTISWKFSENCKVCDGNSSP